MRGVLYPGERVSGVVANWRTVSDLMPDQQLSHERPEMESKGQDEEGVGWEPKMGDPWKGGSAQKPLGTPGYARPKE